MKQWIQGLLAAAALLAPVHAESLAVTDVRFWSLGDVTRIAVQVSGDFHYSKDRLSNPERLFFDLKGAKPQLSNKPLNAIKVNDGLVKQIRIGANGKANTRIVLDLAAQDIEAIASQLSAPDRLIIELRRKGAAVMPAITAQGSSAPAPVAAAVVETPVVVREPVTTRPIYNSPYWVSMNAPAPNISARKGSVPEEPVKLVRAKYPPRPATAPVSTAPVAIAERPFAAPAKNKDAGNSMTRALGLKIRRVVIDAGHGGKDEGTAGPTGLKEKELVLDVSRRLGGLVTEATGAEVILTREDDRFIGLERRTQIANEHHADLFLSVHANSSSLKVAGGVETYYLSFTTSKTAMETATRENAASERSIFELKDLLQKIALKDKVDESRDFATKVQSSMSALAAKAAPGAPGAKNRGIKKAPFIVLIGAQMPSVLAEIGFVSNPREEALLKTPAHRQKIAEALLKGIENYIGTLSHFEVARGGE